MSEASPQEHEGDAARQRQISLGFMFSHSVMGDTSRRLLDIAASHRALLDLLLERGLLDRAEYDARRQEAFQALAQELSANGLGLFLNDRHEDKYVLEDLPEIDCAARLHLCRAACCTLRFPLSRQDVEEGVVRWDYGRPYWNLRVASGYCVHCGPDELRCQVYEKRPGPCRTYDCRQDERIWADFDAMEISDTLAEVFGRGRMTPEE
jgi:Fe-S-cluster containining protein